jgi:ferrous-iron efflux pump FieF
MGNFHNHFSGDKNQSNLIDNEKHNNLIRYASYSSVLAALIIVGLKFYGWAITNSSSFFTSLIDSLLDITTSLVNMIAIRFALAPPDNDHRFGHEKIQDLAVFAQSSFFMGAGFFAFVQVIRDSYHGQSISNHGEGMFIMALVSIVTFILLGFQTYVLKKTKSKIISVDRFHYIFDFLTNLSVIICLYISETYVYADSILGVLISIFIVTGAFKFVKYSIKNLIDQECDDEEKGKIIAVLKTFSEIKGAHDLKTRRAAEKYFIQVHLEMDPNMTLIEAHEITDKISDKIKESFENSEIIIHQDPYGFEEDKEYIVL